MTYKCISILAPSYPAEPVQPQTPQLCANSASKHDKEVYWRLGIWRRRIPTVALTACEHSCIWDTFYVLKVFKDIPLYYTFSLIQIVFMMDIALEFLLLVLRCKISVYVLYSVI